MAVIFKQTPVWLVIIIIIVRENDTIYAHTFAPSIHKANAIVSTELGHCLDGLLTQIKRSARQVFKPTTVYSKYR